MECLKRGAADYLLKDHLARLGQAVADAREAQKARAERRRREQALQQSLGELEERVHNLTAGLAVANAKLQKEIALRRRAQRVLHEYARRTVTLQAIGRAILKAHSPEEIARAALGQIRRRVPCEWAGALALDFTATQVIVLALEPNGHPSFPSGTRFPAKAFDDLEVLRRGEIHRVEDILAHPSSTPLAPVLQAAGLRSYISGPLVVRDELIGSLILGASRPAAFTPEKVANAREVSRQLAVAIEYARLFEQASAGRQRSQMLSRQLIMAHETERRHLARELHDEIGQALTTIRMNIHALNFLDGTADHSRQAECLGIVDGTIQQVRNIALELRPSMLDNLGLVSTLRWLVDRQAQRGDWSRTSPSSRRGSRFPRTSPSPASAWPRRR